MKPAVNSLVILFLIVLMIASCGPVTPVPLATATILPSATPAPSLLRLSPSDGPDKEASSYRLRSWREEDYAQIAASLSGLADGQEGQVLSWNLADYQLAFQLERLLRFPDSADKDKILWNILINKPETMSIPGKPEGDDLMSSLISGMMAQNIRPDDVSGELESRGLRVENTITVHNMIGNGQDGLVLLIGVSGLDSLIGVFVIYSDGEKFHVHRIRDWEISESVGFGRYFELYNVGDTNRNGLPEIVVQVEAGASGTPQTWKETIDQIEWSSEKEIFQNRSFPVFWQDCDRGPCKGDWKFSTIDSQSVLTTRSYWSTRKDCPDLALEHIFVWKGTEYSPGNIEVVPPNDDFTSECRLAWAETAIEMPASLWENDIVQPGWKDDLAISIVEQSLRDWPARADEIWGPAGRDYFKLKLGIWYELRDEGSKANSVLRQVAHKPYHTEYSFISRLASAYLQERTRSGRAKACLALEDAYFEEFQSAIPEPSLYSNDETTLAVWGIVEGKGRFCDAQELLPLDVQYAKLTSPEILMQWLDKLELIVYQKALLDLNNDALKDYVILLGSQNTGSVDAWAFLATSAGYRANIISDVWMESEQTELNIPSIKIDGGPPAYILLLDGNLVIFRVGMDSKIDTWGEVYGVKSFDIVDEVLPAKIVIQIDNSYDGQRTITYMWNAQTQSFIEQTDPFISAQQTIEDLLYSKQDYEAVIRTIDEFLRTAPSEPRQAYNCSADTGCQYLPERYIPYFRYLRGLAYEQLGQNEQAKQAYFDLWRDFPKNVFGMAASLKLEPVNP